MSSIGVRVKLDVSKIDKNRLFKGAKGTYLDATVFIDIDQKDQYDNNGFIAQDVSKEEREQDIKGPIVGNVQVFWKGEGKPQQQPQQHRQQQQGYQQQPAQQQQPQQAQQQYQQQGGSVSMQNDGSFADDDIDGIPF
jgi:hypothetical protein